MNNAQTPAALNGEGLTRDGISDESSVSHDHHDGWRVWTVEEIMALPAHEPTLSALVDDQHVDRAAITWDDLTRREPRLLDLLRDAEAVYDKGNERFCANIAWYGRLKPKLQTLVGWTAERNDRVVMSERAYDVAYHTVYNVLPNCRNCFCVGQPGFDEMIGLVVASEDDGGAE